MSPGDITAIVGTEIGPAALHVGLLAWLRAEMRRGLERTELLEGLGLTGRATLPASEPS